MKHRMGWRVSSFSRAGLAERCKRLTVKFDSWLLAHLTNLLDFFSYVYNVYDDCRSVDIIYLDFQKAFDKVPHMRLLTKFKAHGVTGHIHKWIEEGLSKRKQREVINGISSG